MFEFQKCQTLKINNCSNTTLSHEWNVNSIETKLRLRLIVIKRECVSHRRLCISTRLSICTNTIVKFVYSIFCVNSSSTYSKFSFITYICHIGSHCDHYWSLIIVIYSNTVYLPWEAKLSFRQLLCDEHAIEHVCWIVSSKFIYLTTICAMRIINREFLMTDCYEWRVY